MNENYQFDVYQEICTNICWSGDHNCMEHDDDNQLLGINVKQLVDHDENGREEKFLCEKCEYISMRMEDVKTHYLTKHKKSYLC